MYTCILGELACRLVNFLPIFVISASIFSLVAMAYERQHAIVQSSKDQVTEDQLKVIIALIWSAAFLVALPSMIEYSVYKDMIQDDALQPILSRYITEGVDLSTYLTETFTSTYTTSTNYNNTKMEADVTHKSSQDVTSHMNLESTSESIPNIENSSLLKCGSVEVSTAYSVINGVYLLSLAYVVPLVLLIYHYGKLVYFIRHRAQSSQAVLTTSVVSKKKIKIVKMLCWVTMLFIVSWLPYFTLLIVAVSTCILLLIV